MSRRYRPSCVKCQRGMEITKSGVHLVEMFNEPPRPYRVWLADLWECPKCGYQITRGFGNNPIMEHYEDGFDEKLADLKATWPEFYYEEYEE